MTYENFVVPNIYWEYVLGQRRASFINDYYKKNKNYPTEDVLKNVALTTEEKEQYKRIFYAQYKATGIVPSEPNTPQEPDVPSIPPVSGGDETETPTTPIIPPSSGNMVNVMFDITMDDIPETVGIGNNAVNTIFKQGILNGDLLDKSYCNIILSGGGISIKIKDLTQIYSIPKGEYSVTGIIGNKEKSEFDLTNESVNHTYLQYDSTILIEDNKLYYIKGNFTQNIIASNSDFAIQYFYDGCNASYGGYDERKSETFLSYVYKNYQYVFTNNFNKITFSGNALTWKNILGYNFIFDNVSYEIRKQEWPNGSSYYYSINTNTDYDEWFTMVYNVTTTKEPTKLFSSGSVTSIGTMKIDGELTEEVSEHTFNTLGRHEVKVLLKDTTKNDSFKFENVSQLKELSIPSSINSLSSSFLYNCGGIEKIYSYAQTEPSILIHRDNSTFYGVNKNGILFIPQDSDYKVWLTNYTNGATLYNYNWTKEYMK